MLPQIKILIEFANKHSIRFSDQDLINMHEFTNIDHTFFVLRRQGHFIGLVSIEGNDWAIQDADCYHIATISMGDPDFCGQLDKYFASLHPRTADLYDREDFGRSDEHRKPDTQGSL
jgi:hypothetical protein